MSQITPPLAARPVLNHMAEPITQSCPCKGKGYFCLDANGFAYVACACDHSVTARAVRRNAALAAEGVLTHSRENRRS